MASELGVGYISIVPEVSKISPGISAALKGVDPVAEQQGRSMGGRLSSGIGMALKASVAGVGVAAGGVLAGAISKGMGRLTGIENAQASLRGLGHDAQSVGTIMDSALASVKGTAFGLETAAGVAASAVAAGIKPGADLERTLKMVGDAATIAGADMSDMGRIVNQVATADMMQMDTANQLMDAGIPILQMVADEMGVTAAEARKLASDGKISFETFQTALEEGVGGAALEAGDTFQGAASNMGAALGRLGATGLNPFFDLTKDGMGAATAALDGLESRLAPLADNVSVWLQGTAVPAVKDFSAAMQSLGQNDTARTALDGTKDAAIQLVDAGRALAPVVVSIVASLGEAGAALGISAWGAFVSTLKVAGAVLEATATPLGAVADFLADHPGLVMAAVAAWTGMKTVPGLVDMLGGRLEGLNLRAASATEGLGTLGPTMNRLGAWSKESGTHMSRLDILMQAVGDTGSGTAQKLAQSYLGAAAPLKQYSQAHRDSGKAAAAAAALSGNAWDAADRRITGAGHGIVASVTGMAGTVTGVGTAAITGLRGAASSLMGLFGGPWGVALLAAGAAIGALSQANQKLDSAQDNISATTREAAVAQKELQAAVVGTTGALNEQALGAAAGVVKGELSELVEMGEAYSGWLRKVDTDTNVWERMFNTGGQWEQDKARASEIREEYKALEGVLKEAGVSFDELNAIVAAGGGEYTDLVNRLRASGEGGERAAEGLEQARAKIEQMVEDARRLEPATVEAAAAIDVLADSASSADDKLGALQRMLQAMGLAPKDAELAMRDAAESVDEIVKAAIETEVPLANMGQGLLDAAEAGDWTHAGWRDLSKVLEGMGDELQNVATNGGDVAGTYETQQVALDALAKQYGISREELDLLARSMGVVPDEIRVSMALEGADEASKELANVWARMQEIPPGQEVRFNALTNDAVTALADVGFQIHSIPGSTDVNVTATTQEAQDRLDQVFQQLAEMEGVEVQPTVLLNTTPLMDSARNAEDILAALNIQEPSPQAGLIIQDLLAGVAVSQGELDFLAAQSPTPVADLQEELLRSKVQVSHEMLEALQNRPTTPVIGADSKPLVDEAARARAELDRLPKEVITKLRIQEWREYYTTGTSTGGTSVGQHYGATGGRFDPLSGFSQLPRYLAGGKHGGYRLPSTGPGTEIVDGFLALDQRGMPVARLNRDEWVINDRSSDKFDRLLSLVNQDHPSIQHLTRLETGGKIGRPANQILAFADGQEVDGERASRSLQGALYDWAGINWGDCSAAMAGLARFATGVAPFAARFATGNQRSALAALGFRPGLGNPSTDFSIGWLNGGPGGGHTSGTIAGTNVEMGGGAGGNGKIGGAAAPANHPQYTDHAHLPLAGSSAGWEETSIASTSTSGVTLESGITVNWGEAADFYETALGYLKRPTPVSLFDTGGILPTGGLAFNAGPPERILPATLTRSFDQFVVMVPGLVNALQRGDIGGAQAQAAEGMQQAARTMLSAAEIDLEVSRKEVQNFGSNFGGEWVGQAQIVRDAEDGLVQLRKQLVIETRNISSAEDNLVEAQKRLTEVQSEGAELSTSAARKITDAEEALAKARTDGKADKIADAEKRLARAREDAAKDLEKSEDKKSKDLKKALEDVAKAEETLSEARETNADAALRLEAAERAIAAARYQAVADMVTGISASIASGVGHLSGFFDEMGRLAGIVDQTRQAVSKLQMEQVTNQVNLLKAQHELRVSEWDLQRVRARGAINLVEAEMRVEDARAKAARMGSTSVEAMSGAMDRFRTTGVFAVGDVSDSVIENSREVEAALWGVQMVEAQNALDALNASHQQTLAGFAVTEATLTQIHAAEMLQLQTAHLEQQTAQLYGLTQNQATGASKGFGGLGGLLGGLGQVGGGILGALAGFAVGGPLGAIPGIIGAVSGAGSMIKGGIDLWNNRDEVGEAWGEMGLLEKAGIIGGGVLGAGAGIAGGYLGGPEGAVLGSQLGSEIIGATIGSFQYSITSRMEKQNRDHQDRIQALQQSIDRQRVSLGEERLITELDYLRERDRLEAEVSFAELMQQASLAANEELADRLLAAAEIEAARAGRADADQLAEVRRSADALEDLVDLMSQQNSLTRTTGQGQNNLLANLTRSLATAVGAGGNAYLDARL